MSKWVIWLNFYFQNFAVTNLEMAFSEEHFIKIQLLDSVYPLVIIAKVTGSIDFLKCGGPDYEHSLFWHQDDCL